MSVPTIPPGYHSITPYLIVDDASAAIDFYKKAFGGTEIFRLADPSGKIGHAEVQFGDARIMLADEFPDMGIRGPKSFGGTPVSILLYVDDVDAVYAQAVAAGATGQRGVQDQFYGDRSGMLTDPFGHTWAVATHKEDVSPEEMQRRFAAFTSH